MFRFAAFFMLVFIAGALLFGSETGGAAALGVAAFGAFFLLFKVLFFFMLVGFASKLLWHRGGPREWRHPRWHERSSREPEAPRRTPQDDFDEWHRLAHAKEEVDGWAPEVE